MAILDRLHGDLVHTRRVGVLSKRLAALVPPNATVLDVGCGDGLLAKLMGQLRPDLTIEGIDVLVRRETHIPVHAFDGRRIEFADRSFDAVMFVDVLHHTEDPEILVAEAMRVARSCILIKDHTQNGLLARRTLAFMDWVSNARHGVALPYNYWPREKWREMFARRGLEVEKWEDRLKLYPWWGRWVFERKLQFIARLGVPK